MNNPVLRIKINAIPAKYNIFDLMLVSRGRHLLDKESYSFSMNAKKNWVGRPNKVALKIAPCSDETTSVTFMDAMTMNQKINTYYSVSIPVNTTDHPLCRFVETTITLGFAHNLQPGDELWIDNLSLR